MDVIAVVNNKGGCAKTITALSLAQAATHEGKKVLLIDLDGQANISGYVGAAASHPGSYELLTGAVEIRETIQHTEQKIDVIGASANLTSIKTRPGAANILKENLSPIAEDYDLIIIDTPPQTGILLYTALAAATKIVIPVMADTTNLQGMYTIIDIVSRLKTSGNSLEISGAVLTNFDGRANVNKAMRDLIKEKAAAENVPYLGEIRTAAVIKEAAIMRSSLYSYSPKSKPAADYMNLLHKLCN